MRPCQPNVTNRQPTATAMPLPPLNPSQGLKMCPHTQPKKANRHEVVIADHMARQRHAAAEHGSSCGRDQARYDALAEIQHEHGAAATLPMVRMALVVPMLPEPCSRMSVW